MITVDAARAASSIRSRSGWVMAESGCATGVYGAGGQLSIDKTAATAANAGMNLTDAEALDRADPLARFRDRFSLPEGVIYLDGNSLGALPKSVVGRIAETVRQQWGQDLITSWNRHDWIDL